MNNKNAVAWILLLTLACIWGSSFFLMKRGMVAENGTAIFSDIQVGAMRIAIAGFVMLPFGIYHLRKIRRPKHLISLLIVGLCGNFFPAFLFTFAETRLSSGMAGMLNSFTPFFTILIGWLVFKKKISPRQFGGLLLAFLGIFLLLGVSYSEKSSSPWIYPAAVLLATVFYATSLNTIKHTLSDFSSIEITSLAFSLVFLPSLFVVYKTNTFETIATNVYAEEGLIYITILSLIGTCLALFLFNRVIALKSAVFASSVTYIIPMVAVLLGVLFLREHFYFSQITGVLVIISGVFVTNTSKVK